MLGYAKVPKQCIEKSLNNYQKLKSEADGLTELFTVEAIESKAKLVWRWSKFKRTLETKEETRVRVLPFGPLPEMAKELPRLHAKISHIYCQLGPVPMEIWDSEVRELQELTCCTADVCYLSPVMCQFVNKFHKCEF